MYASLLLLMLASSSPRGFVKWREAIAFKCDEFPLNWKDNMNRKYCSGMPAGLCKNNTWTCLFLLTNLLTANDKCTEPRGGFFFKMRHN